MYPSIFSDELRLDITEALPHLKSWGLEWVDFRGRVFDHALEVLPAEKLPELRKLLDDNGFRTGTLCSSLCKVHLPDDEGMKAEFNKLEGLLRAADALDCRLVRGFFLWQPGRVDASLRGALAIRPDELAKVLERFAPIAERAKAEGLVLAFENCGTTVDECLAVLQSLGVPEWGLAWDPHNEWKSDERKADEDAYIRRLAPHVRQLHVKAQGALPELGDELIPYDKIILACREAGINAPISAEAHGPDPAADKVETSRRVVEVIHLACEKATQLAAQKFHRSWEDNPVGYAVIGLGVGHGRSRQINRTPGCRLVTVCDLDEERCKRTAEECGVPYTTQLQDVLNNDEVEVVYVTTETGRHGEIAIQAMEAGKHVLVTKPMEASLEACDEMLRVAEERGVCLGIDFDLRFSHGSNQLQAAVSEGYFGKLLSGYCALKTQRTDEYFNHRGGWRGTRRLDGGGVLSNQAIHSVDELVFTLGLPRRVRCELRTLNHSIEAEDWASALWEYDNGLIMVLDATTNYPQNAWHKRLEIFGTEGGYVHASGGPVSKSGPATQWLRDGEWTAKAPVESGLRWMNATDNFAAWVRGEAEYACPGSEGRRSQSVLHAMYVSAYTNNGDWVEVESAIHEPILTVQEPVLAI